MPELPEIEATVRLLDGALRGGVVDGALAPGLNALKTFAPPLQALAGATVEGLDRRGKLLFVHLDGGGLPDAGAPDGATLVIHLMSAGRLQLWERRAGPRDRTSRVLLRIRGGGDAAADVERELRLREFGTKQAAWVKLLPNAEVAEEETIARLGPEAFPDPPSLRDLPRTRPLRGALRDQRVITGIGRSWADEILWEARLAPLRRCGDLDDEERERLRTAMITTLGGALEHYREVLRLPIPDKAPMPLQVHRRVGEPCPRCGTEILGVHYEDDEMAYCPTCQTNGRPYKDRRLSRLLKE